MAEDNGDKTEAPTARRRQEAREAGQVARSQDLSVATLLLAAVLLLSWFGPGVVTACQRVMEDTFRGLSGQTALLTDPVRVLAVSGSRVGMALAPILIGLILVAVVINLAQVGFYLSPEKLAFKWDALNPVNGLSRIFGRGQGAVSLLMNLVKMALIGLTAYSAVANRVNDIVGAQELDYQQIFVLGGQILYALSLRIAVLLLVLAILDYAYQRYKLFQSLKMTKQEVKDEMKNMEGDPRIKQRRRQIAMQRHQQRIKASVPQADVVVTNPTHYAVALQYDPQNMGAPKVVAKGADYLAKKIRELAIAHGVPLLERPPLARALYRTVEVGQEVPEEYYAAVAEILAYVYEISGKSRQLKVPA